MFFFRSGCWCFLCAYKFTPTSQGVDHVQIMSHRCRYRQKRFTRAGSRRHHERYTCWKRLENGQDKLPLADLPSSTAITRVPKITFPTGKNHGIPNEIKMGEAFRFKTASSILIVGPSGCGKTCFTETLLLDFLEELFVSPPPTIHYCYGMWQHGFQDMKDAGKNGFRKWFPKGGLLVLDDLMVEGGEDRVAGLIHQTFTSRCCTCARTCFHQGNTQRAFPGAPTTS